MTQGPAHLLLVPGLWWLFSSASCTFTRLLLPWGKEVFAGPAPPPTPHFVLEIWSFGIEKSGEPAFAVQVSPFWGGW